MSDLPNGWISCPLSDVLISLESGSRPRGGVKGISSGVPSIGGEHLTYNGGFDFLNIRYVPDEFAESMKKGHIEQNDILIVKDGATTGKISFVDKHFPFKKAVVNEHIFLCKPSKHINSKFVFRFLQSEEGQKRILENFRGSAQGGINTSFAPNTIIPIAPLNEQKRIVEKLDKLLAKVESAKARLEKIPKLLKQFRQAVLSAAVSGELTREWRMDNLHPNMDKVYDFEDFILPEIPESWKWAKIIDLASDEKNAIKAGPFGSTLKKSYYVNSGYKVYGQEQVIRNDPYYGNYFIDTKKFTELESCKVKANDVLISLVGTVGKILILPENCKEGIINPRLIKITLNQKIYNPYFLKYYFYSPVLMGFYKDLLHGSTMDVLNLRILKILPFPILPVEEQNEIVKRVNALFNTADQIEARYQKAKAHVDQLQQAILAKAFRGELVPQDPNDLPAPRQGKWFIYVLECEDGSLYKGHTKDILERWKQHASGKGAEWTKAHPPRRLIHWEKFDSQEAAAAREKELKSGFGRKWLQREIEEGRTRKAGEPAEVLLERIKKEK